MTPVSYFWSAQVFPERPMNTRYWPGKLPSKSQFAVANVLGTCHWYHCSPLIYRWWSATYVPGSSADDKLLSTLDPVCILYVSLETYPDAGAWMAVCIDIERQARIQDFLKGGGGVMATSGGGGDRGWSPLSAKNYYLNTQNFQLQGGGVITPTTPHPPPPCIRHWEGSWQMS